MTTFDISSFEERLYAKNEFDGNLKFGAKKFHHSTSRTGEGKPSSGGLTREQAKVIVDSSRKQYQRIEKFWEDVNECPACFTPDREFFLSRMGLDIYRCKGCSHRYMHPRIKYNKLIELYSDDKTASDIYTKPVQKEIDVKKYQYGIHILEQLSLPGKNKVMDFGCGAGVFLEVAQKNGWKKCIGVDANSRYSSIYENGEGIQYINSSFEDLDVEKLGKNYDAITMWNVFEHLYDVHKMLKAIDSMLKKGGVFLLMIPNVESLATRLIRDKSPTFNWKHVHHFSIKSLRSLMGKHGFLEVHLETVITEIDNIKSYLSGEYPYHGYGDPENLFDFITPEYIHRNYLGSRILAAFRKR